MAWKTILPVMVRHLIGDISDTPTYTTEKIQEALVVAGLLASQDYDFTSDYTFDFGNTEITPDPTETATLDMTAMALFTLKAACVLNLNTYQNAVTTGISVKDGSSSVDTTAGFGGYRDILNLGPCGAYEKMLKTAFSTKVVGKSVMSPPSISAVSSWGRNYMGFWDYWR